MTHSKLVLLQHLMTAACLPWLCARQALAAPNDLFGPPYAAQPQEPNCSPPAAAPMLISPTPMIQSGPPVMPMPLTPSPAPMAAPMTGPMQGPALGVPPEALPAPFGAPAGPPPGPLEDIAPGGKVSPQFGLPTGPEVIQSMPSSIVVPVTDDDYAWDTIADVVSDYFTISSEQRARRGPEVWSEGCIQTAYQSGATLLEPHRNDSVGWFNLWESTFQTIRRRAVVRVVPEGAGYLVEVEVLKELEDLHRPEHATAGAAAFQNDGSLPSYRTPSVSRTEASKRWISLGRDPALEQRILADIHARLAGPTTSGSIFPTFGQ